MRRTIITFAVRSDADVSLEALAADLARALNCPFHDGVYERTPALVAEALGVEISLLRWRGVQGKKIFRLHGEVTEARFVTGFPDNESIAFTTVNVSNYIADLLSLRTPYHWYLPSAEDLAAEQEYAILIDRAFDSTE